jgi:hypothetical protein
VATALNETARQKPPQPEPHCCIQKGFYWDVAILYEAPARWQNAPTSAYWDDPVYRIIPELEKAFLEQR